MPVKGGPTIPQAKSKNFDEELRMKLKDRKRRGLTTGLSDTAEESDSDDSLDGQAGGDDFLSQFTSSAAPKNQPSSFTGSSKPWAPPVASPRQQGKGSASPSPSPRGLPSPKGVPSPRGLPSPIPRARNKSIDKFEEAPKRRLSSSSDAVSVSPRIGVHPKDLASTPLPKPRSRTSTIDLDSPGRNSTSSKLTESPRMKSEQSEVDKLLGLAPLKTTPRRKDSRGDELFETKSSSNAHNGSPESRQKTRSPSIIDDLLGEDSKSKARSKSPESKSHKKSPEPKIRSRLLSGEAEESPISSRKIKPRSGSMSKGSKSPELKSKNNSVLDDLLTGGGKTKSRSSSPEPKGRSRSPSILDNLLNGSNNKKSEKVKQKAVLDDLLGASKKPKSRSGSPEPKPKPRSRGGSPPPLDRSRQRKSILDSDGSEDDKELKRRNKRKSPSPSGRGSPKGVHPPPRRQKGLLDSSDEDDDISRSDTRGKPRFSSPKTTGGRKSPTRKGILDSSDNDADDKRVSKSKPLGRSRSPSPKGFKTSAPSPKPRSRPGTAETKAPANREPKKQGFKVDDFLDSGSDLDVDEKPGHSGKPSLLDVLEDQQSPKSRKKKKKMGRNVLEDSDDTDDDVFKRTTSKKKPPVISGRRPKEGYQSADEEVGGKEKTQAKIVKPMPKRPGSSASSTGGKGSLNSSLNNSINVQDSSSIRQAIYDEWRAQKQEVAVKQAREKKKKEKEDLKKKELEVLEKRAESAASFNAWKESKKGTLQNKAKEEAKKKKKLKEEEEEKMMKTIHARKAFEAWKGEKDEHLKEQHRKKIRNELKKTHSLEEEKELKKKDSQSAFRRWKSVKDEDIIHQTKEKRKEENEKKRREEEARKAKEEESMKAYEDWERKTERRKERDAKRMARTQPISTMPFRPSGKTIPHGR